MKVCPLAAANPEQKNSDCIGEACACYVQLQKPRVLTNGKEKLLDQEHFFSYFGCGLVTHIPWKKVECEDNSEAST
jgi:hypothetical protein